MSDESLPTSPFDVIIGSDRQFVAAARTTTLENLAPIGSGHTLAETVHAHATADPGLIRSFRHFNSSLKGIILLFNNCQAGHKELCGEPCFDQAHDAAKIIKEPFKGLSGTTLYRKVPV